MVEVSKYTLNWFPERMTARLEQAAILGLERAAIAYETEVKRTISLPGPLRGKYTSQQQRRLQQAGLEARSSRPGEPPRKRTGALRSSITHVALNGGFTQRVGSALAYARYLEWGSNPHLKPRPFFRPALARMIGRITVLIVESIRHGRG